MGKARVRARQGWAAENVLFDIRYDITFVSQL